MALSCGNARLSTCLLSPLEDDGLESSFGVFLSACNWYASNRQLHRVG